MCPTVLSGHSHQAQELDGFGFGTEQSIKRVLDDLSQKM